MNTRRTMRDGVFDQGVPWVSCRSYDRNSAGDSRLHRFSLRRSWRNSAPVLHAATHPSLTVPLCARNQEPPERAEGGRLSEFRTSRSTSPSVGSTSSPDGGVGLRDETGRLRRLRDDRESALAADLVDSDPSLFIELALGLGASPIARPIQLRIGSAWARDYDLRHTFGSRLVQAGVDLYTVQRLGRWKSMKMVQHYGHHYPESLRDGAEVLDRLRAQASTKLAQSDGVNPSGETVLD